MADGWRFSIVSDVGYLGLLTATADDAALAFAALEGVPAPAPHTPRGLRLGRPTNHFFDNLDPEVENAVAKALAALEKAGAEIVPLRFPKSRMRTIYFTTSWRLNSSPSWAASAFSTIAIAWTATWPTGAPQGSTSPPTITSGFCGATRSCAGQRASVRRLGRWVNPTRPIVARPLEDYDDAANYGRLARHMAQNTRHGNAAGLCAASIPVQASGGALPVGLQVACAPMAEEKLLSIASMIEISWVRRRAQT